MPKRIQMSRQRPWRADNPDAVIVSRPSKWGNPFRIERERCEEGPGGWCWVVRRAPRRTWMHYDTKDEAWAGVVDAFSQSVIFGRLDIKPEHVRAELAGRDLACWCPLDKPCHADALLNIANEETP